MNATLISAVLATILSFASAWLLTRLSMAALLLCMPRGPARSNLAEGGERPCA